MGEGTNPTASAAQSYIIKRPRLTKLLDDSGARLILLVAPAGYGKTTLARQWLSQFQRPVAWYRASTASSDVAALATGLAAEIDNAVADDGTTVTNDRMTSLAAVQQRPDVLARALHRSRETWPEATRRRDRRLSPTQRLGRSGDVRRRAGVAAAGDVRDHNENPPELVQPAAVGLRRGRRGRNHRTGDDRAGGEAGVRSLVPGPARASTLDLARGWPVVIGLAARTGRTDFPSKALPRNLYEFLAEDLVHATTPETQQALTIIALTGTNERGLARGLVGDGADAALSEAERRGLLTFESASRIVLHPLLGEFLIERFRDAGEEAIEEIVNPLVKTLMTSSRWDECLAVAEAVPERSGFASAILEECLEELLSGGRVATVRRWITLARGLKLTDPIVELAEAEVALLAGEYDRALALGNACREPNDRGSTSACRTRRRTRRTPGRLPISGKDSVQVGREVSDLTETSRRRTVGTTHHSRRGRNRRSRRTPYSDSPAPTTEARSTEFVSRTHTCCSPSNEATHIRRVTGREKPLLSCHRVPTSSPISQHSTSTPECSRTSDGTTKRCCAADRFMASTEDSGVDFVAKPRPSCQGRALLSVFDDSPTLAL